MRAVVVAVLLGACGRVGFDQVARASDSGTVVTDTRLDTAAACTLGSFGTPQTVAALNSTGTDWGPHMSSDGLELVFSSNRGGNDQLYTSKRASTADAWGAPVLTTPPTGLVDDPELSSDRLSLYR